MPHNPTQTVQARHTFPQTIQNPKPRNPSLWTRILGSRRKDVGMGWARSLSQALLHRNAHHFWSRPPTAGLKPTGDCCAKTTAILVCAAAVVFRCGWQVPIGIMEKKMETTIEYWGQIGIMENQMETTIEYKGYMGKARSLFSGATRPRP